jgi:predicted AAA+ superfamily ATPase
LEASFLVFRLQPYYENFGKRITKSPKLYFTDVGLATYLLDISLDTQVARDPLRGNLVENLVILECLKHCLNLGIEQSFYYYRDSNNNEVDLLVKIGSNLVPIEIKSSTTFTPEFLKNIGYFKAAAKERCPMEFLVYSGEQEQEIGSCHLINYKNIRKIFESLHRGL